MQRFILFLSRIEIPSLVWPRSGVRVEAVACKLVCGRRKLDCVFSDPGEFSACRETEGLLEAMRLKEKENLWPCGSRGCGVRRVIHIVVSWHKFPLKS